MLAEMILRSFRIVVNDLERLLLLGNRFPPPCLNYIESSCASIPQARGKFSIHDFMQDSILWAVPKKRVSIERRQKKKYGSADTFRKTIAMKTDILTCVYCGHDYEKGHLCGNCYTTVKTETQEMQEAIKNDLGLEPIEKEVVVLYEGEKESQPSEFWEGKRIVEMPKPRPQWFSRNLLEKSTVTSSDKTDVKPDHLG